MKQLDMTPDELELLGSLIGHCFCGQDHRLAPLYRQMCLAAGIESFPQPSIDKTLSTPDMFYLNRPMVGKVVSYNIPLRRVEFARMRIEKVITDLGGEIVDD